MTAAPVEASDLHTIRGRYGFTPEFPTVPGIESVGVIDEIDSGADGLTLGQRVITIGVTGTWQDYVIADASRALSVPAGMSDSTAAQILSNPLTAVICTEDEDLRKRVAEIAGPGGVSKAIDCVSGQVGADVSRALAPNGELVVFGALSTHRQTDPDKLTIRVFARSLIYETKTVRGFWLFRWFTETPKDRTEHFSSPTAVCCAYRRVSRSRSKNSATYSRYARIG